MAEGRGLRDARHVGKQLRRSGQCETAQDNRTLFKRLAGWKRRLVIEEGGHTIMIAQTRGQLS